MEGWIKLHRKMLNWEWIDKPETVALFVYCLLSANYVDKEYKGEVIKRGEFTTTLSKISQDTGLSVRQVRTSLDRLISTQSLTKWISPSNHTIIRVTEYEKFQSDTSFDKKSTNNRHEERQLSKNKEYKNKPNSNYIYNAHAREEDEPRVIGHLNVKTSESKKLFADKVKLKRA